MTEPTLVFRNDGAAGLEIVANFALFAGREATPAEIDRLGDALLELVPTVEIVCEQRYEIDREGRASVYQVRVVVADDPGASPDDLAAAVETWARECIAERRLISP